MAVSNTVVGRTNGADSSEFWLAKLFVIVTGALIAGALAVGKISPEQAEQATALVQTFIVLGGSFVSLYLASRTWIKAVLARNERPVGGGAQ